MRAVSFVDRLEFEFQGNVLNDAIVLGDIDNDHNNELAIGNVSGEILVFKGSDTKPWRCADGNGFIASLVVGDLCNENKNVLVSISGEGWCSVFEVEDESEDYRQNSNTCKRMLAIHLQRLMANTKVALLCDIDGDGCIELVIGMSDRVVRSYRWSRSPQNLNTRSGGRLIAQNKWEFANQIGTVSLNTNHDGSSSLMIAQPGGTYVQLSCYNKIDGKDNGTIKQLEYHALSSTKMRNANVSTVIVGNINRRDKKDDKTTPYALATLDGTIMLLDREKMIWSLQVNHQLFTITKLDVTGNGNEEVISCSWEGVTYIVNHDQQAIRFQFEETVNTFTAGHYSVVPGENMPCLVYVTFNNHIYLYYNIEIPNIQTNSLLGLLKTDQNIKRLLKKLKIKHNDSRKLQELYSWLLYGQHNGAVEIF